MDERTITISGLSKTFSVTGWRLGYVVAPAELTDAIRKVHDFLTVGAPAPLQEAAASAIEQADAYYPELRDIYTDKRGMLLAALREAGFRCHSPQGAYYIMADFSDLGFDWRRHRLRPSPDRKSRRRPGPGFQLLPHRRRRPPRPLHLLQIPRHPRRSRPPPRSHVKMG